MSWGGDPLGLWPSWGLPSVLLRAYSVAKENGFLGTSNSEKVLTVLLLGHPSSYPTLEPCFLVQLSRMPSLLSCSQSPPPEFPLVVCPAPNKHISEALNPLSSHFVPSHMFSHLGCCRSEPIFWRWGNQGSEEEYDPLQSGVVSCRTRNIGLESGDLVEIRVLAS